ncbi:MAG: heterodisulfide reductase subunit B [Candidatus Fischerbacteria bacterium RBG_13_37_8]|uniref:Heterodisulfide reductase subunit B n=1 Tax=Candidatus Fischerbacteria bacterium RBG_13_37_8 TaxID=1817863 RepID=A0A1F5VZ11_9BACT|nr:MAG: heterodisulfide reductase subunit B [Candidatus Fischerbacteria bacterium RBG_13_37_8]
MKMGYFPGCSMLGSSREYAESLASVAQKLELELEEIRDWNCCGASAAHNLNHTLSLALPARILALAEAQQLTDILVPCAACYNRLAVARHELLNNKELHSKITSIIEMEFTGTAFPRNILEVLSTLTESGLEQHITSKFEHKVACYYGCLLVRPPAILKFDRAEDPLVMDTIMQKIGATPLDWAFKVECCGAGFSVSRTDLVAKLSQKILDDVEHRCAEAIIVACPMCHSNLDMRRPYIEKLANKKYAIPVLYITQALGLALGIDKTQLGLQRHFVPVPTSLQPPPPALPPPPPPPEEETNNTL